MGHGNALGCVRSDNGPKFAVATIEKSSVPSLYIAPLAPRKRGYAENFHSGLRDNFLSPICETHALTHFWQKIQPPLAAQIATLPGHCELRRPGVAPGAIACYATVISPNSWYRGRGGAPGGAKTHFGTPTAARRATVGTQCYRLTSTPTSSFRRC